MLVKTLLNRTENVKPFIFGAVRFEAVVGYDALVVEVSCRKNSRPICPACGIKCTVYDTQRPRLFEHVPFWSFKTFFRYAPRRADCPIHGPLVERVPWAVGKEHQTTSYKVFLARWARRLSWKETAGIFETSWDSVFRAVKDVVEYGLAHRSLEGIRQIGC